jgi:hypothetical protein
MKGSAAGTTAELIGERPTESGSLDPDDMAAAMLRQRDVTPEVHAPTYGLCRPLRSQEHARSRKFLRRLVSKVGN